MVAERNQHILKKLHKVSSLAILKTENFQQFFRSASKNHQQFERVRSYGQRELAKAAKEFKY